MSPKGSPILNAETPGFDFRNLNILWRSVTHLADKVSFPQGHIMDVSDTLYLIDSGLVRRVYISPAGLQVLNLDYSDNMLVGNLLSEEFDYYSTIREIKKSKQDSDDPFLKEILAEPVFNSDLRCVTPVEAFAFDKKMVSDPKFLTEHPDLVMDFMRSRSRRMDSMFSLICYMATHRPRQRVCAYFLRKARQHGNTLQLGLSHDELAALVGMHRVTLARVLKELREENIIGRYSKDNLEILDVGALSRILAEN